MASSDAYMEVSDPDVWGETHDQLFGQEAPVARRMGGYEITSFSIKAHTGGEDQYDKPEKEQTTGRTPPAAPKKRPAPGTTGAADTMIDGFTIRKSVDSSSPQLFLACCEQKKLSWGIVTFREAGDAPLASDLKPRKRAPWLILEFKELYVADFDWSLDPAASGDSAMGQETITFWFKTILIKYNPQEKTGTHGAINSAGWNRETDTRQVDDMKSETW